MTVTYKLTTIPLNLAPQYLGSLLSAMDNVTLCTLCVASAERRSASRQVIFGLVSHASISNCNISVSPSVFSLSRSLSAMSSPCKQSLLSIWPSFTSVIICVCAYDSVKLVSSNSTFVDIGAIFRAPRREAAHSYFNIVLNLL